MRKHDVLLKKRLNEDKKRERKRKIMGERGTV